MIERDSIQNTIKAIDHYTIVDFIGHGGMSTVYKAYDTQLGRYVAIKLMHTHLTDRADLQTRFLDEGRAIAALDHPNIIRIHNVSLCEGQLFLVMEYIDGGTLRKLLNSCIDEDRFLSLREIVGISRQVSQALQCAHSHGIVHRDVKPDNVLLKMPVDGEDGAVAPSTNTVQAVLTDFGIAKRTDESARVTTTNELLGTLAYIAPERLQGEDIDGRADIYSLGIVLYELVSGKQPFWSDSVVDLIQMHTRGEPERIQDLRPDTPPALVSIIYRAMQKNPKDRYQTAGEIARELEALEKSIKPNNQTLTWRVKPPVSIDRTKGDRGAVTVYDVLPALDRPAVPVDLLSEGADDIIIVTPLTGMSWSFPFEKPSLLVGRDPTCDLQLDDPRVSRQHLRIDRLPDGQVVIADQGSVNGLYLDDNKLEKNAMVAWPPMQSVKIGPFWLTLRLAKSPVGLGRRVALAAPRTIETAIIGRNATMRLTPAEAVVEPGSATVIRMEITNQSEQEQFYLLNIQGLPSDWFTMASFQLHVMPNKTGERVITFHPPRLPSSTATNFNYQLIAYPDDDPRQITALTGILQVFPFYAFDSKVEATRRSLRLSITNQGNNPRYYVVEVRELNNVLVMLPSRMRTLIIPGQVHRAEIAIRPKRRRLFGKARHYPIDLFIRTDGLRPRTETLDFVVYPLISWLLLFGLFIILATIIAAVLFFGQGIH